MKKMYFVSSPKLIVCFYLFVNGQIFSAASAEKGSVNLGHVLEEPLDVRPLPAQLALLPYLAGLDPSGVIKFNAFRIGRWREVVIVSTVVDVTNVMMVISVSVVELGIDVIGRLVSCTERKVILWTSIQMLMLLLVVLLLLLLL